MKTLTAKQIADLYHGKLPQIIHDSKIAKLLGESEMVIGDPRSECVEGYSHRLVVWCGVGSGYYVREDLCSPNKAQSPSIAVVPWSAELDFGIPFNPQTKV